MREIFGRLPMTAKFDFNYIRFLLRNCMANFLGVTRSISVFLTASLLTVVISSCSSPRQKILGKWKVPEQYSNTPNLTATMEFLSNGTYIIKMNTYCDNCVDRYEFISEDKLILYNRGKSLGVSNIKFEGDYLIVISEERNETHYLERIK